MVELGSTPAHNIEPKHILVVDDEGAILEVFQSLFRDDGYRMSFAEIGQDAVDIIRSDQLDLLVVDKNLPDMNGLDVLKIAKEVHPLAEVIVITGYASLETVIAALELDAFDYMLKPFHSIFAIKKRVRMALEKQEMALENQRLLVHLRQHAEQLERALEERKRVEAELIQSEKLAGIGTLAAGIAHEVSSPLFGILGLAEAIVDEEDLSLAKSYATEIVDYSKQIREIVQELSAYSRTARTEGVFTISLDKVAEDALRLISHSKKTIQLKLEVDIADDLMMQANPNEIRQLLVNLLGNAADALSALPEDKERKIAVKGWRDDGFIHLKISDTGRGIPPQYLEKVFDPFFTTKDVGQGTGLGLHIVHRIVKKNNGSITVESIEGVGTSFSIRFPVQDA